MKTTTPCGRTHHHSPHDWLSNPAVHCPGVGPSQEGQQRSTFRDDLKRLIEAHNVHGQMDPDVLTNHLMACVSEKTNDANRDTRPHSRACGPSNHPHGPACHSNCPTCGYTSMTQQQQTPPEVITCSAGVPHPPHTWRRWNLDADVVVRVHCEGWS